MTLSDWHSTRNEKLAVNDLVALRVDVRGIVARQVFKPLWRQKIGKLFIR
jgi:hypothetical protein